MRALLLATIMALAMAGCTGGERDGYQPPTNVATFVPVSGLTPPTATPPPAATPTAPAPEVRELALRTLGAGQMARIEHTGRLTFTDAGAWSDMWMQVRENGTEPVPEVDFERESVLLALHGPAPDGCTRVRITNATVAEREVRAVVTTYGPPEGAACPPVVVFPWHAVAVAWPEARAVFEERTSA